MLPDLSVVICTHNPRPEYFHRVLAALRAQTLDQTHWELLVVDNASANSVASAYRAEMPDNARSVVEPELGLTPARRRGMREASGGVLIFVDDDNLLAPDYLATAADLAGRWPILGVWGGQQQPEWEVEPPAWARPYLGMLALRELEAPCWHNFSRDPAVLPTGAGLCIRRQVAEAYLNRLEDEPWRQWLDRRGDSLLSCGDFDLALTALKIGLGMGLFPELRLTHLIPANRVSEDYLLRLREGISISMELLELFDSNAHSAPTQRFIDRVRRIYWRFTMEPVVFSFHQAHFNGLEKARKLYNTIQGDAGRLVSWFHI